MRTINQPHRGNASEIAASLAGGAVQAREEVGDVLDAWGHARRVKVNPRETFDTWLKERRLGFDGRMTADRRDDIVERLLSSWEHEPGDTLADDAVNAVTRAAHETPDWSQALRASLERSAGELVYASR